MENLAWATAQIHCYCSSANDEKPNEATTSKNVVKAAIVTADTALNTQQGQGNVVLETKPKILFCDLRLSPGETRSCKTKKKQDIAQCKYSIKKFSLIDRSFQRNTTNVWSTNVSRYKHSLFL